MTIREKLIDSGVRNLKEFGYPAVNSENILTDYIYSRMFKSMVEEHRGTGKIEAEILIKEIEANG